MVRNLALLLAGITVFAPVSAAAFPDPTPPPTTFAAVPQEVIVRFKADASEWQRQALRVRINSHVKWQFRRPDVQLLELESGSVDDVMLQLAADPLIEYIEPNYRVQIQLTPDDPRFSELWGLRNVGQTGGTPGADIRALATWDVFTGDPEMRVGVIDTGVDYNHPDLVNNIWTNPGEIPANGVDDDGNGYVDDVHGYDFVNFDGDPMDDYGHGTHVSGTIAGTGNNGIGVTGVNWRARIVGIKFLDASGFGSIAGAIAATEYTIAIGLKITNNSWGGGPFTSALLDVINEAGAAGQLYVAAAGNGFGNDNDVNPQYPASYSAGNIISVAATDHNDVLANFSNIGATTVDLAAPGADVLSTIPFGGYLVASGTSMAAPHVAGTLALLWGHRPGLTAAQAKARLMAGVDPRAGLAGKMVTGGRLNALLAVGDPDSIPPGAVTSFAVASATSNTVFLTWLATGDDGAAGRASAYDLRYSTAPITEANFDSASPFPGPDPQPAGSPESFEVTGLAFSTTYYFALRAMDEFANPGPMSNVASATTLGAPDVSLSPTSISATLASSSEVRTLTITNTGEGTLDFTIPAPVAALAPMIPHPYVQVAKGAMDPRIGTPVVADQGGPDGFGYRWVDSDDPGGPEFDWVDITGDGALTMLSGDEDVVTGIPIGFPFSFYGNVFDSVNVAANGWLSFTDVRIPSYNIQPLPSAAPPAPANLVAPFWADLNLAGTRRVYVHSDGDRFVVSWIGVPHYFLPAMYTFQAQLYRSGEVRFQYHTMSGPDSFTSIGIQNASRDVGLNIAFFTDYARPGLAVRILPPVAWLSADPRSGRVPAGSSQVVDVTLDATALLGGTYRADLHVTSNDPDESDAVVPVQLVSIGVPEIDLSATAIDFGSLLTGGTVRETLLVRNPGTDSLRVTSITVDHPAFVPSATSLVVPPLGQRRLFLDFTPLVNGPSAGTLTVLSNDADEGEVTVALSGTGLPPPDIAVSPESLFVGLDVGGSTSRTLRVANPGESELNVVILTSDVAAGPGSSPTSGGHPPMRFPVELPPAGPAPTPPGPETNADPRALPPVALAGVYTGTHMTFGITDFGEIMPFQFPSGTEHLAIGSWVSGYTVGLLGASGPDSLQMVYTAGHDYRSGIVPVSFEELEISPSRVIVRVTTQTYDGLIRIVREITFHRDDQFVHVATRLDNLSVTPLAGVVFKEFADWDMDNDPSDDGWNFDTERNLVLASDLNYAGLAAGETPQQMDLYGWDDFASYGTFVNYPVGPVVPLDGLAVIHFELGTIASGATGTASTSYCAGNDLADLLAVVDRAGAGVRWLSANPDTFTVSPGDFVDVVIGFDATELFGGDHRAIVRLVSNDPNEGELEVPVLLRVTGVPNLLVTPAALTFDTTFVGLASMETLLVQNPGTDSLRVTSVESERPAFTVLPTEFVVAPTRSHSVVVTFAPTVAGADAGPLLILSNDPDLPVLEVPLHGVGLDPPIAAAAPDSFLVGLYTGESRIRTLALTNSGGSNLRARIEVVATSVPDSLRATRAPAVLAVPQPRVGRPLDTDWPGQSRAAGPALQALPPPSVFPTSSLPLVIEDPAGDGGPVDLVRLRGASVSGELRVAFELAGSLNMFDFGGYLSLDTDQDPTTGVPPYFGAPGHDIGQDVVITLFSLPFGYVEAFQTSGAGAYLGAFPVVIGPSGFSFAIPLSALGDDGRADVSGVIGTSIGPTDWFPDTGHGSFVGATWLVVTPSELTVPAGETIELDALFNAAGLNGGDYLAEILIQTNDPGPGSTLTVPSRLTVTGAPDIAVSASSLDFGNVFLGFIAAESLVVSNEGTDILEITAIGANDPAFAVSASSFMLEPGASQLVMVSFTPSAAIVYGAGLEIRSNDVDEPFLNLTLAGQGLVPPIIAVTPESLFVGLLSNQTSTRTLRVANPGGSDLHVTVDLGALPPPDSTGASPSAGVSASAFGVATSLASPRRETPGDLPDPGGSQPPPGLGPEINTVPRMVSPRVLAGSYSGTHLAFGITDFGEIMPFQFPIGNEHLALGGWLSGYTVACVSDSFARVFWSGHDTRFGIVPVAYEELAVTPARVVVRVTTVTSDGSLRIIREFDFLRAARFIRVKTRLENVSGGPLDGVVYKEFADWDMDGDFNDDSWDYDRTRGLAIAWDSKFAGIAGGRPPDLMDAFGWSDYSSYNTYVDFPVGPINNLDGMALLHFDQGSLVVGSSISTGVIYCAGDNLADLQAAVDQAQTDWLSVDPNQFTVPAGGHLDLSVRFDATGLFGGDYQAEIRLASNDPYRGDVRVPALLRVTGVPDIHVAPDAVSFDPVFVGVATAESLEVQNLGTDVLEVSAILTTHPAFSNDDSTYTLDPGASRTVMLRFLPDAAGPFAGTAEIHSNDPDQPVLSIALSGTGLVPPDVSVSPESLSVTLIRGQSGERTLRVANSGGSDLVATVLIADPPPDSTGSVRVFLPDGSAAGTLVVSSPETNTEAHAGPPRALAGVYTGANMAFGVTDLGEIMPYQFPIGSEHLAVGTRISGYTVASFAGPVYVAGHDTRYGIEPVSYQELAVTPSVVSLRVTTRTIDGRLHIIRDITFRRADQFVHVATTLENQTSVPFTSLVFKEFADWDVDGGAGGDWWQYEPSLNMVYAWDGRYVGISTKDTPTFMDAFGWNDYAAYMTTVDVPSGPAPIDGLALIHFNLAGLGSRASVTRSVSYCAGTSRPDLFAVAERAGSGPSWIDASPGNLVVAPGGFQDLNVRMETGDLDPGEHRAVVRLRSNDPDKSEVDVPVRLTVVLLPDIAATPRDFGTVYVGQSRVESVVLRNEGSLPLTITGMTATGDFALEGTPTPPDVPPGGALSVAVRFAPTAGCEPCTGSLIVSSNDPDENPFTVPLTGIGVVPPEIGLAPSTLHVALAPALGPPATMTSRVVTVGNPGGSALTGRAVAVRLALPPGARVIASGPLPASEAGPGGPRVTGGGPDEAGYTWIDSNEQGGPVFEWVDIAQGVNRLPLTGNDNVVTGVPIGFDFPFYGGSFDAVNVNTNGWLSFTSALLPGSTPFALPSADPQAPRHLVAPFWENLTFGTIQRAYAFRDPERFVVTYVAVSTLPLTGTYTFQTILHADGRIVFQYLNVPIPAPSLGTIGIQNGDGTVGLTVSHGASYVERHLAVEITPGVSWLRVVPGVFEVQAGENLPLGVLFDAVELGDGDHQALVRLTSNDLETPVVDVPVTVHVGAIAAAFTVNLRCDDDGGHEALVGDDDDDDGGGGGGGGDDDDDDGGGQDDDDDGGQHDDDDDGGRDDDDDDGPARWVRGVITLPAGYDPQQVVLSSVLAAGSVPVSTTKGPRIRGQKLKVWFDRAALLAVLPDGDAVPVTVIGEIDGQTWFQGTATACLHRPNCGGVAAEYQAGSPVPLNWSDPPGMTATAFDVWFSADAGETWSPVARGLTARSVTWVVPNVATTEGMLGLVAFGPLGPTGSWRSEVFRITGATADVVAARGLPGAFGLRLAGPNPSREGAALELGLPTRETVAIAVYDVRGARVRSYPAREFEAGWHRVSWEGRGDDGRRLGAGVYFVRGTAGRRDVTVRVAVLK